MEKSWIQSLLHSSSSTFGLMVNFSFGNVWTTQFWILKEFIATSFFGTLDGLKWKSHEYQYCSTHQDLHLIYRPFLYLTKCWEGVVENPQLTHIISYSLCEIRDLVGIVNLNFLKWKNCLYKNFRSWWYLKTWYSIFFPFK